MTTTLEAANEALRNAVRDRLDATPADDPKMQGYVTNPLPVRNTAEDLQQNAPPLAGCRPAQECAARVLADAWRSESCCDGGQLAGETYAEWVPPAYARQTGDGVLGQPVHPTSQAFFDLCDALKDMHRRKSSDYGCPSGTDPLANIRNGAKFVGIPDWKGAMVRLSDKVTRLATYNATGRLENESLEDNLFDLASYSLLALLLHREEHA